MNIKHIIILLLISTALTSVFFLQKETVKAAEVQLRFNPAEIVFAEAETTEVEIIAENLVALSGFEIKLKFDSQIIQIDNVSLLDLPAGTIPLGPSINNKTGRFQFGALNPEKQNIIPESDTVILAKIAITAKNPGITNLIDNQPALIDTQFNAVDVSLLTASITVSTAGFTLFPGWNMVKLPLDLVSGFRAKTLLNELNTYCATVNTKISAIGLTDNNSWQNFVSDFGGNDFQLEINKDYWLKSDGYCLYQPADN